MFAGLYARLIGIGLILVAVASAIWYVRHLQSEVVTLTSEKAVLVSKIDEQNRAVEAFKLVADKRLADAQEDLRKAKAEADKKKSKATTIYKTLPSDPANLCGSALTLLNGGPK